METIRIPRHESEPTQNDDPRVLLAEQYKAKRSEALARLQKVEQQVAELQAIIDRVDNQLSLPTVLIDIAYIGAEFDIYTYSEHIREVRQYALTTDSLIEALTATAHYITDSGIASKNHFEPHLDGVSVQLGDGRLVPLELSDELGLRQYFKPEY